MNDLNSENGKNFQVTTPDPNLLAKKDQASPVLSDQTRAIITAFDGLAQQLNMNGRDGLTIYPARNIDHYRDVVYPMLTNHAELDYTTEQREELTRQYNEQEPQMRTRLEDLEHTHIRVPNPDDPDQADQGFVYYDINNFSQSDNDEPIGRLYFNFRPEQHILTFEQLVRALDAAGVSCSIKTAMSGKLNYRSFSRTDKAILYFHPDSQEQLLSAVRAFYKEHQGQFLEAVPGFSAPLLTDEREPMHGVAFGEEPNQDAWREAVYEHRAQEHSDERTSFSDARVAMLLDYGFKQKQSPGIRRIMGITSSEDAFAKACAKFDIDPADPAFNGTTHFTAMKLEVAV